VPENRSRPSQKPSDHEGGATRDDLVPGCPFPDLELPDKTGSRVSLGRIADGQPLILAFVRGWRCSNEQVRIQGGSLARRPYGPPSLAAATTAWP
jgi:hypothetical protein